MKKKILLKDQIFYLSNIIIMKLVIKFKIFLISYSLTLKRWYNLSKFFFFFLLKDTTKRVYLLSLNGFLSLKLKIISHENHG